MLKLIKKSAKYESDSRTKSSVPLSKKIHVCCMGATLIYLFYFVFSICCYDDDYIYYIILSMT